MRTGAVLPNKPRALPPQELPALRAIRSPAGLCIRSWDYTPREAILQVIDLDPASWFVLRSRFNGAINAAWAPHLFTAARTILDAGGHLILGPCNEPNHPSSPYTKQGTAAFERDYRELRDALRHGLPGIPTVSPNLAVHSQDIEWATDLRDLFTTDDYIGVNAYWQWGNELHNDWGLRLTTWHDLYPTRPLLTLETGDSTPGRSSRDRARRIHQNLSAQATLGYVAGAAVFILGGTPDWAPTFHYEPADWAAMRPEQPPTPPPPAPTPPPAPAGPTAQLGNLTVSDLRDSLPASPSQRYTRREPSSITLIVVHHSATPPTTTPEAIATYHVNARGWPAIAYHVLVTAAGEILYTGDLTTVRHHAAGANPHSVGLCLIGTFTNAPPPAAQLAAARQAVAEIQYQLGSFLPVQGHRNVSRTACPGATWQHWRERVTVRQPD